ncbi:hypothetical protein K1T71_012731 [Dendrolimus kikuchii]|uniref:Uncharacterized protein n=1 Tax=Dendrolimus kikuchii TaxID=765133 RepID=A0ACC1CK51_9NEOP|nr:hypothetical protein K1T71_012731 [Dendrolimus kikuchii]
MGDFNTCLLKQDHRSMSLESLVTASGLTILPLKATHYFPNSTPSLLDLIIVSSPSYVISHGQCSADAFSYHDLIFLSYNIRPPKAKTKVILQRNFGGINLAALVKDAQESDWSGVFKAATVDEKVYVFNTALLRLYDLHAPMRRVRIKHLPAPWLTDDIKKLIHKKSMAKTKYKLKPSDENKQAFIRARNRCNRVCRDAQRRYIHESVEKDNPSKVWKFLKSLGVGKSVQNPVPNNFDIDSLNQHFTSTKYFDKITKSNTLKDLSSIPTPLHPNFILSPLSECDVKIAIKSISSNAVGSDGISRGMIVPILDVINPIITHILNSSIASCIFPVAWKEAHVIPLPKKPNPSSFSEFRPISILPFLSKVLERLVHKQFSTFLSQNSLMNPFQSGFRPGHSTVTALVKITDDIRHGMENGLLTILSLLDFSSAFNNVDYDLLLDDLQIYTQSETDALNIAINKINSDLDHILRWSKKFGLAVNPQKTQLIIVGSPRMNAKVNWSSLPQVLFDGTHIPVSDTAGRPLVRGDKTTHSQVV